MNASIDPNRGAASAADGENALTAPAKPRAPWQPPCLTLFPLARTELGGTIGNEGNGVFAFMEC
jgi:hypothetical protein